MGKAIMGAAVSFDGFGTDDGAGGGPPWGFAGHRITDVAGGRIGGKAPRLVHDVGAKAP
ncbi:hypothetical protein [Streptomyces sp. PT12]|uniref:hypothetical protein n=1 Tax=Streptomyces sp. PT12 TaxID=1510197 RepID=UPI0015EE8E33|nr:hypothetical protein [Streptomyces sp. PT12]